MALLVKINNHIQDKKALHIDTYEMTRIWEGKGSRLKVDKLKVFLDNLIFIVYVLSLVRLL